MRHHQRQQLVLQALLRHAEVDQCGLRVDLRLVVRVGQLGLQVQPELGVVLHLAVSDLHDDVAALLDGQLADHGVQHRVNVHGQVLDQQGQAVLDAVDDLVDVLVLRLLDDDQAVRLLAVDDPLDALQLRVDHQGPAGSSRHDSTVLNGQRVSGQALVGPASLGGVVSEQIQGLDAGRHGDAALDEVGQPLVVDQLLAEVHVEGAGVRHKRGGHQHVAHQPPLHALHPLDLLAPARVLARQPVDQAVRQLRLAPRLLRLRHGGVLVGGGLHQALLQRGHAVLQLLDARADAGQLLVGALQLLVRLAQRRALGRHHLVDAEVLADVDHPAAQAGGGGRLGADVVGAEPRVGHVLLLDHGHAVLWRVVLVKVDERLEERVHVAHGLLASRPADVLGHLAARCGEHHAGRHHLHHLGSGAAERLELAQRRLVQRVQRGLRLGDDGLGRLQVARALLLERLHLRLQLGARLLVLAARLHRLVHHRLLLADGHDQLVGLRLLLLYDDLLLLERLLQVRHLRAGLRDLVHAVLEALLGVAQLGAFDVEQLLVQ
mmetsp:Transcript_13357/g.32645  ORF Transcript_13357/g.32645 Transcript_13357/m.32645 type:complete len:547 (-) Transcript_13357:606-2246(-)